MLYYGLSFDFANNATYYRMYAMLTFWFVLLLFHTLRWSHDDYADNKISDVRLTTYRVNTGEMISQCMNILEQHCINPEYRHGTSISYGNLIVRNTGAASKE